MRLRKRLQMKWWYKYYIAGYLGEWRLVEMLLHVRIVDCWTLWECAVNKPGTLLRETRYSILSIVQVPTVEVQTTPSTKYTTDSNVRTAANTQPPFPCGSLNYKYPG